MKIELKPAFLFCTPVLQIHRRADLRDTIAAALFAGRNGNFLPLLDLFVQTFRIQFNAAALRKKWRNEAYTQFNGFLNGELHLFPTRHHLAQVNVQRRFPVIHVATQHLHVHAFFIGARNFSVENLIRAVKELNRLACTHAQHAAYMVCGIIRQGDFAAWGNQFRVIDARDAHSQKFHVSCDISELP